VLALGLLLFVATRVAAAPTAPDAVDRTERDDRYTDDTDGTCGPEERDDDDACESDDTFDYLRDFDLERPDALRRLVELEAAALAELDARGTEGEALDNDNTTDEDDGDDVVGIASSHDEASLRDPDAARETFDAEDDAAFDDPAIRDAIETGSAFTSTAFADASELGDLELRHQRPSRWGRLDLTVAWRRVWSPAPTTVSLGPLPHGPLAATDTADTLWLLATWSR